MKEIAKSTATRVRESRARKLAALSEDEIKAAKRKASQRRAELRLKEKLQR